MSPTRVHEQAGRPPHAALVRGGRGGNESPELHPPICNSAAVVSSAQRATGLGRQPNKLRSPVVKAQPLRSCENER